MADTEDRLTDRERGIATEFGNVLDMAARLMLGGNVSKSYFYEKFSALVASSIQAAELLGFTPGELSPKDRESAAAWRFNTVWKTVAHEEGNQGALGQIWTALQYDNPYYTADYPPFCPIFRERPYTLDDPKAQEWHLQIEQPGETLLRDITVRGFSAADAVRNAYYLYPGRYVQINALKHDDQSPTRE